MRNVVTERGFFERSFMFRMIRDFFLLLVVVAAVELLVRYVVILYEFKNSEPERVQKVADELSNDIRLIMLNAGGPTAARTIYPIIDKNYDELGLMVAVIPSQLTIDSILISQQMDALGLTQEWPSGPHTEASVAISAEQYCLGCHIKAKLGDVLGTVTVRSYFDRKVDAWLHEVQTAAGVLSLNILIHTLVLFLLLKSRMQPLLALRSTVSSLARGLVDVSPRTAVKSEDEFGDLAKDLNHFLDRITLVVKDLDLILSEVLSVGSRLNVLTKQLESQCNEMKGILFPSGDPSLDKGFKLRLLAAKESGVISALTESLSKLENERNKEKLKDVAIVEVLEILGKFQTCFSNLHDGVESFTDSKSTKKSNLDRYDLFVNSLKEMALLEASMQRVAKNGQETLRRVVKARENDTKD